MARVRLVKAKTSVSRRNLKAYVINTLIILNLIANIYILLKMHNIIIK